MSGLAQKLFNERAGVRSWKEEPGTAQSPRWPQLEKLVGTQVLPYIDFALAQRLLSIAQKDFAEDLAALICHLSLATRQGHLCVTINAHEIFPSVESIWISKETQGEVPPIDYLQLTQLIHSAAKNVLLHDIMCTASQEQEKGQRITPLYRHGDDYYLQRYWQLESEFLSHLPRLLKKSDPDPLLNETQIRCSVDALVGKGLLLPEQAHAVIQGCLNALTLIIGGPGTGKTYTAGVLLRTFWHGLTAEQRQKCRIALAAPTGKAAANLEMSIKRALNLEAATQDDESDFPLLKAQTLHHLLGIGRQGRRKKIDRVLPYDILLVDECSMIDAQMMTHLLASIKSGARLILLGDPYQLPPVEIGSFFADLVSLLNNGSCVIELKTCLRSELRSIIDLASYVKAGDEKQAVELLNTDSQQGTINKFWENENPKEIQHSLLAYAEDKFPLVLEEPDNPLMLMQDFLRFRLLTPMRHGMLGVEELNARFFEHYSRRGRHSDCLVVPIMIRQNNSRLELFNGEVGLLVKFRDTPNKDYAFLPGRSQGEEVRKISALLLPAYEYAYCLSIHKSQGSEFNHVLMLLPEGSDLFGREALYTGITRARQIIEIWGSEAVLRQMIENGALRRSGIVKRGMAALQMCSSSY